MGLHDVTSIIFRALVLGRVARHDTLRRGAVRPQCGPRRRVSFARGKDAKEREQERVNVMYAADVSFYY